MLRRLLLCALAALVVAPAAFADGGPSPGVDLGGTGLLAAGGKARYVALPLGEYTAVQAVDPQNGSVLRWNSLRGLFGLPRIAFDGSIGGLSVDGRTLVLGDGAISRNTLKSSSAFVVLDTRTLGIRDNVVLRGDFAYDALSPDASRLYLIQHLSQRDLTRYVVRAFDLQANRLLPGRIADRTQRGWVMSGTPMARATSDDGRWAYTLYANTGGYPFVHALDTVRGVAHCVGIPFKGAAIYNLRLDVRDGGRALAIHWLSGRPYLSMDTTTWKLSRPGGGFPWWTLGAAGGAALFGSALLVLVLRRRRRAAPAPVRPVEGLARV